MLDAAHALQSHGVHRFPRKRMPDLRSEQQREEDRRKHGEQLFNDLWRTVPQGTKKKKGPDDAEKRRAFLGCQKKTCCTFWRKPHRACRAGSAKSCASCGRSISIFIRSAKPK